VAVDTQAQQDEIESRRLATADAEGFGQHPRIVRRHRVRIGILAANPKHALGRNRHVRQQRRVRHAIVRVLVRRRHAALVAEEHEGAVPRHLRRERRLRQATVRRARRGPAGQCDGEAPTRGHGCARHVDDFMCGDIGQRDGIVRDADLERRIHGHDHTLSSSARCRFSASR
jgi:hypothetical protein